MSSYYNPVTLNDVAEDPLIDEDDDGYPQASSSSTQRSTVPPTSTLPIPSRDYGPPAALRESNEAAGGTDMPSVMRNIWVNVKFLCRAAFDDIKRAYSSNPKLCLKGSGIVLTLLTLLVVIASLTGGGDGANGNPVPPSPAPPSPVNPPDNPGNSTPPVPPSPSPPAPAPPSPPVPPAPSPVNPGNNTPPVNPPAPDNPGNSTPPVPPSPSPPAPAPPPPVTPPVIPCHMSCQTDRNVTYGGERVNAATLNPLTPNVKLTHTRYKLFNLPFLPRNSLDKIHEFQGSFYQVAGGSSITFTWFTAKLYAEVRGL